MALLENEIENILPYSASEAEKFFGKGLRAAFFFRGRPLKINSEIKTANEKAS
jgi:hypothetical protein